MLGELDYNSALKALIENPYEGKKKVQALLRSRDTKQDTKDVKLKPQDFSETYVEPKTTVPVKRYMPLDVGKNKLKLGETEADQKSSHMTATLVGTAVLAGLGYLLFR